MGTAQWLITENRLRERIAHMLGAESGDDISLLKNTSEGICVVANGISDSFRPHLPLVCTGCKHRGPGGFERIPGPV